MTNIERHERNVQKFLEEQPAQQADHSEQHLDMVKAQPEQEPVQWGVDWGKAGDIPCVSIIKRLPDGRIEVAAVEYAPYSYTSPPAQRTWVGLTKKEVHDLYDSDYAVFHQRIEAKLKEKNT